MYKFTIFPGNNAQSLLQPLLEKRGNWTGQEQIEFKSHFIWKPEQFTLKVSCMKEQAQFNSQKFFNTIYNHLTNHCELTTKTGLLKNLRNFYMCNDSALNCGYQVYDSLPTSFLLTAKSEDCELQNFINRFNELSIMRSSKERMPVKHCLKNIWIIKPANLNQGKGIELCKNLNLILKKIRDKPSGSLWVIQKYIERPLLIAGRKFDIRIWAMATGKRDLFYYKLGYVRTSSFEYNLEGKDTYIHLTNNCLQQFSDMYGTYEEGNTISFDQLQTYLNQVYPSHNLSFNDHLAPRMKDLIIDSYLSCKKIIEKGKNKNVFELLGYDFLIDEDFRVWLLEVNTNPYLGIPNEYIGKILPDMLDDMLALTVDLVFEPSKKYEKRENLFELIYCEAGSVYSTKAVNKRQSFATSLYPVADLAQKPLCKQCVAYKYNDEEKNQVLIDFLQLSKNLIRSEGLVTAEEYSDLVTKILNCLKRWKKFSVEQIENCFNAFTYFFCNSRQGFLSEKHNLKTILELLQDSLLPESFKLMALSSITELCKTLLLKKFLVNEGLVALIVENLLVSESETVKKRCKNLLVEFSENPDRKIYVPGKSIQNKTIRESFLAQGGLTGLLHQGVIHEKFKKKLDILINSHYSIDELSKQVLIIKDNLQQFGEFPEALVKIDLGNIIKYLEDLIKLRNEENLEKILMAKRQKEEQERKMAEKELLMKKKEEEKKEKIKIYLKKKDLEIKRQKIELEKNIKLEKDWEIKLNEDRKWAFMVKQSRKNLVFRRKHEEDKDLKALEQARKKLYEKNKKKQLKEWGLFKKEIEKKIGKSRLRSKLTRQVSLAFESIRVKRKSVFETYEKLPTSYGSSNTNLNSTLIIPVAKFHQNSTKRIDLNSKALKKSSSEL